MMLATASAEEKAGMEVRKQDKLYTFDEWMSWDEDVRAEIHDGKLVMMAPPTLEHQEISGAIFAQFHAHLKGKPCKVYAGPVGVRLEMRDHTVFEPDIIVVCDQSKLEGKIICTGAPDLVVEILSPSTVRYDTFIKFQKYQAAGVAEYWIVDPESKAVQVFLLENGRYVSYMYQSHDVIPVAVLPGCEIALADVFEEEDIEESIAADHA